MNRNQIIKIVLLVAGVVALVYVVRLYMNTNKKEVEDFEGSANGVAPSEQLGRNAVYGELETEGESVANQKSKDCFPKDQLNPSDLLPGKTNSEWAQSVPSSGKLGDSNFLDAGYHVGVNTVGQSLRNANRQLRSEPSNPQVKVSPWMQTTIDADSNRKPLEIGGAC